MRPLDNAEYNPLRRQYLDGSLFHGGGEGDSHGGLRGSRVEHWLVFDDAKCTCSPASVHW